MQVTHKVSHCRTERLQNPISLDKILLNDFRYFLFFFFSNVSPALSDFLFPFL